ncbi:MULTISPECIES: hypothetical protein [unclassified Amycolatopsis]|uniref:hypothetical protein n=1 Tax=unclassified Amycolatopsis TaxID=2618356 RepID=UPI001F108CBD|nr:MULTISPECIES: hypothetical protein [unclassified Amycolatopsis]
MPTRVMEKPVDPVAAWLAPLADDPAGAVAFLSEVTDRVSRRHGSGRVLVPGGGPVADALAGEGYEVHLEPGSRFDTGYLGADVLSRLPDQRDQLRAIGRYSRLLRPGGALVVQGRHPDPACWTADARVRAVDDVRQIVHLTDASLPLRYVWPAELDLMAELAGLALDSRWGGWYGEPVTCGGFVVSVYRS